jgi:hypothetical protein
MVNALAAARSSTCFAAAFGDVAEVTASPGAVRAIRLLATASGELVDLDHAPCWLWLAPNEDTPTIQGMLAFTAEYRTAPPVDLPGWRRALEIGVKSARLVMTAITSRRCGHDRPVMPT